MVLLPRFRSQSQLLSSDPSKIAEVHFHEDAVGRVPMFVGFLEETAAGCFGSRPAAVKTFLFRWAGFFIQRPFCPSVSAETVL